MASTDQEKKNHLIPEVYLSKWANSSRTTIAGKKGIGSREPRNIGTLCTVNNFFSIKAGYACCTENEAKVIFKPLEQYRVYYNDELIESPLKLNFLYYVFDNWSIKKENGDDAPKKALKSKIGQQKVNYIERQWSRLFESKWADQISLLERLVSERTSSAQPDLDFICSFILTLDWRSLESNAQFQDVYSAIAFPLDKIIIPKTERGLIQLNTASEEIKHEILLKGFRELFDKRGIIYQYIDGVLKRNTPLICIADSNIGFQTSDNPSFVCKDGKTHLCPITPSILIALKEDKAEESLKILQLNAIETCKINKTIRENAREFILHHN